MSIVGTIWGWVLISCPIVFIGGLVWINRARQLNEPIDGVPSMTRWILVSAGSFGVLILMGGILLISGLGHGQGSELIGWIAFPIIVIGPFYYFASAMKWITRVKGGLNAQQSVSVNRY